MTTIVANYSLIPANARRADKQGDGTWLVWLIGEAVPAPTGGELAAVIAYLAKQENDAMAALQYNKLTALAAMTPAQVQAWVAANVLTLLQAQDAITTLAVAVSILARRL